MDFDKNNLPEKAKKLVQCLSNMMEDLSDENGKITKESIRNNKNKITNSELIEKLTRMSAEIDNFARLLDIEDFESNNADINKFATAVYYALAQSLPVEFQYDKLTMVSILTMVKIASFAAYEAGKADIEEKSESKDMLEKEGFEEELEEGFGLEEWAKIVRENKND